MLCQKKGSNFISWDLEHLHSPGPEHIRLHRDPVVFVFCNFRSFKSWIIGLNSKHPKNPYNFRVFPPFITYSWGTKGFNRSSSDYPPSLSHTIIVIGQFPIYVPLPQFLYHNRTFLGQPLTPTKSGR